MIIHHNLTLAAPISNAVITMGSFDGVHKGHRIILEQVVEEAARINGESVLITFDQHPRVVLRKNSTPLKLLTTPEERRDIFQQAGIRHLLCLTFDAHLAAIEAEEFIRTVFVQHLHARKIIMGYGHRFGKGGKGDYTLLEAKGREYGFETAMIPMQDLENNMISSTLIRHFLEVGDVSRANTYLGYSYRLSGSITQGSKIGKSIGFPTANITPSYPDKLIPGDGVYAVKARLGFENHHGMMNIGIRPTVGGSVKTIEVHLFDFNRDVYGEQITITFEQRIRDEKKFNSIEELREQLFLDKQKALAMLA